MPRPPIPPLSTLRLLPGCLAGSGRSVLSLGPFGPLSVITGSFIRCPHASDVCLRKGRDLAISLHSRILSARHIVQWVLIAILLNEEVNFERMGSIGPQPRDRG